MSRFLETVRIQNGIPRNLSYHDRRVRRTLGHFHAGGSLNLERLLLDAPQKGTFRARILYDRNQSSVSYHPYRLEKKTKLLTLTSDMDYTYKFAERKDLDALAREAAHSGFDDALIIKSGLVTDTTIANIAFWDGKRWLTPDRPLLRGTLRQRLVDARWLHPVPIAVSDMAAFSHFALMNALSGFYPAGPTTNITLN